MCKMGSDARKLKCFEYACYAIDVSLQYSFNLSEILIKQEKVSFENTRAAWMELNKN